MLRLLVVISLGTAGVGRADVLMEPFGGQALQMTVSDTTQLTVVLALGSLIGFGWASCLIGNGMRPLVLASAGAAIGVPAFGLIILSAWLAIRSTILRSHPLFMSHYTVARNTRTLSAAFGLRLLSPRKTKTSAMTGTRFMSKLILPFPLLTQRKAKTSAIRGTWTVSGMLGNPTISRR